MAHLSPDIIYQLHIQLADIEPPIWRRIVVSGQRTLFGLHQMLQVVMGWENSHLHQFIVGKTYYGEPDPEYGDTVKDDRRVRLRAIARKEGVSFIYEYDFGDSWQHVVTVEGIQPLLRSSSRWIKLLQETASHISAPWFLLRVQNAASQT